MGACRLLVTSIALAVLVVSTAVAQLKVDTEVGGLVEQAFRHYRAGKYADAAASAQRAVDLALQRLGPDHPQYAGALTLRASIYRVQGQYGDAEPLFKRALAIFEGSVGAEDTNVAVALSELAQLYYVQGRLADAEPLYKRAIDIKEKVHGPEHAGVATLLNNLAALYRAQGRYGLAESLRKRTIVILEKAKGPNDPDVAIALDNLAILYMGQGKLELAEPLIERALSIFEKTLGPDHPDVAIALNNLATLAIDQRKYARAEPLFERSLSIYERALGPDHLEIAKGLDNLAGLYRIQGKYAQAEPIYKRALAIFEANFGSDHPDVGVFFDNLGGFYFDQHDWVNAIAYLRKGTAVAIKRAQRGLDLVGQELTGRGRRQAARESAGFVRLVKAAHGLAAASPEAAAELRREAFLAAQWAAASEAAASLQQMAVRSVAGDARLGQLVRERQDLLDRWRKRNGLLAWARSQPPDQRNAGVDRFILADIAAIDERLAEVDRQLKEAFPQYSSLAKPESLEVAEVQSWLSTDEALLLVLDTPKHVPYLDTPSAEPLPEETFVWVATKTDMRWVRIELGTAALGQRVAALRCGLDHTLWQNAESAERCRATLGGMGPAELQVGGRKERVLPFDLVRAHALYDALFGPVADLIKGKHLLIVPSGPLTTLPLHVLVTEPQTVGAAGAGLGEYRSAAWLGARQAITVLPSVASLKSLRQFAKSSRAARPYLAVGNPLLDGQQEHPDWGEHYRTLAQAARNRQQCPKARNERIAAAVVRPRASFAGLLRGGHADIEHVRLLSPLPETADELCEVGRRLGAPESDILLGGAATEAALKELSASGRLGEYAILHFATHGALTGQVRGAAEPGLVLTPPPKGTSDPRAIDRDDGYLSASEIAALKLDAEWVVLSACNTAGGTGDNAEALSGLARAFFYAGARALLVSHWEVGSDAAVKLTTRAFAALKTRPEIGRAAAMRISMREMIEKGGPLEAHPSQWGPFVVVGEGGGVVLTASTEAPPARSAGQEVPQAKASPPRRKAQGGKKATAPDWRSQIWKQ